MRKLTFLLLACCFVLMANAQVRVTTEGNDSNDGSTWALAKKTIKAALTAAGSASVKEVWVKAGTYKEAWGAIPASVGIYGGFSGTEDTKGSRMVKADGKPWEFPSETVITLEGTGVATIFTTASNKADSYIIDGFSFRDNKLAAANFVASIGYNAKIQNCVFDGNSGMKTLISIWASGANYDAQYAASITNCLFVDNETVGADNLIKMGTSGSTNLAASIEKCLFIGNTNSTHAIVNMGAKTLVANSIFYNNSAGTTSGFIVNGANPSEIVNCVFYNNKGNHGTVNTTTGTLVLNCTVANNIVGRGGIDISGAGAQIYNTIVRGNEKADGTSVGFWNNSAADIKYCAFASGLLPEALVQEGANNLVFAKNDFEVFVTPSTFKGINRDKDAELAACNWALTNKPHALIDGGNNASFAPQFYTGSKDIANNDRIQNTTIDLGAYENANAALALPTLTTSAGEGGTATTITAAPHFMGEGIVLTASQNTGYQFLNWTNAAGDVVSEKAEFIYEMLETSTTLTANFEAATVQYTLTVVAGANGTVSSTGGQYYSGEKVELTAIPNAEYVFAGWTDQNGNTISRANPYTLTMEKKDTLITANFKYHLTRYLVSPKSLDEDNPAAKWDRNLEKGEILVDLDEAKYSDDKGEHKGLTLDVYFKQNLWASPLGAGDEIWLLGGDYQTFQTIQITAPGVKIYGGFAGTESSVNERTKYDMDENGLIEPWEFENQTTLAGQMIENGIYQSVLRLSADDIEADGLVVEGGRQGSGIDYGVGVDLGLRNDGVRGAIMRNSIIRKNLVTQEGGAGTGAAYVCGVYVTGNSTLESCLVENNLIDSSNKAASYAAGISAGAGTKVLNCVIRGNRNEGQETPAQGNNHGGGLKLGGEMTNCLVYNNTALRGGGVYAIAGSETMINYCTIANNAALSYADSEGKSKTSVSGGGVYFRGIQGTDRGGQMYNSIVWNNSCTDGIVGGENIYIQGGGTPDPRAEKVTVLGANAYNAGSAVKSPDGQTLYYRADSGNENSIENLPTTGVFVKPMNAVGSTDDLFECDWRPKFAGLNIAVQQAESEKDILGNPRLEMNGAIGAYIFNSSTGLIPSYKKTLDPFVYCSGGQLRVNYSEPVAVEVFDIAGVKVATAAATTNDHIFSLPKGRLYVVVVKCGDLKYTTKTFIK